MKKVALTLFVCLYLSITFTGCTFLKGLSDKKDALTEQDQTFGQSVKEITKGMTAEDVVGVLGPTMNILQDSKGRSVMIYDRMPASKVQLSSLDKNTLQIFEPVVVPDNEKTGQRPKAFTVIIKFNRDNLVSGFEFSPSIF